jgi:hypothetical protein
VAAANITGCLDEGLLALDSLGGLTLDDENSCGDLEKDIKEGVKSSGNLEDSH